MKLKNIVRFNSLFSAVNGVFAILFHQVLSELMGVKFPVILMIVGGILVVFSIQLWVVSIRERWLKKFIRFIILLDLLWVVGSVVLLMMNGVGLSFLGQVMVGAVAIIVGGFALLQHLNKNEKTVS